MHWFYQVFVQQIWWINITLFILIALYYLQKFVNQHKEVLNSWGWLCHRIQKEILSHLKDYDRSFLWVSVVLGRRFALFLGVIQAFSEDRGLRSLKYEDWGYETLQMRKWRHKNIKIIKNKDEETCSMCFNSTSVLEHFWRNFAQLYF